MSPSPLQQASLGTSFRQRLPISRSEQCYRRVLRLSASVASRVFEGHLSELDRMVDFRPHGTSSGAALATSVTRAEHLQLLRQKQTAASAICEHGFSINASCPTAASVTAHTIKRAAAQMSLLASR